MDLNKIRRIIMDHNLARIKLELDIGINYFINVYIFIYNIFILI
jgi:hypothetical protein